jgi:two-component system, cell cycle sensor histidine kinase and response regulator CckA
MHPRLKENVDLCWSQTVVRAESIVGWEWNSWDNQSLNAVERLQETKPPPLLGGSEIIFVVEDTQLLRELTRLLLEGVGYQVLDFGVPEEAIRMAKNYVGSLPLLITDIVMPGMSGIELAEEFAKIRPETKLLYASGYADDAIARHGGLASEASFLEKPFTRDALLRKVRGILDSSG